MAFYTLIDKTPLLMCELLLLVRRCLVYIVEVGP